MPDLQALIEKAKEGFVEYQKKLKGLPYEESKITEGVEKRKEVEAYSHWMVTVFNIS